MSEETIKKILKDFGLTEKETEVYLLLAKNQLLKGGDIAKSLGMHKAQVYRSLKSLQDKSIVESTLESPIRFTALPFENVLDFFAKVKREEAALIDEKKQDLIESWNKISKTKLEVAAEKFAVMKGKQKINSKTLQMIKETRNRLSIITTIPELVHADQMGLFNAALHHPLKSEIQFRVLTKILDENLKAFESLFRKATNADVSFIGRTPELDSRLPPRMIIRDDEEIIFYITPKANQTTKESDEICLWTNCKALVQAFHADFEDAWAKAIDILEKIAEKKLAKIERIPLIDDAENARKNHDKSVKMAKKEILMITSTQGLHKLYEKMPFLIERAKMGVSIKIMAPIVSENINAAQHLAKFCTVRHIPTGYLRTTIVDDIHLFQFNDDIPSTEEMETKLNFKNTFYTNESEYVGKTKTIFNDIWENALAPSPITLKTIIKPPNEPKRTAYESNKKIMVDLQLSTDEEEIKNLTEMDIINIIINAQAFPDKNPSNNRIVKHYGTACQAVIHPPAFLNLPDMLIMFSHYDKHSTYGEQDFLIVFSWVENQNGKGFVPSAFVYDNVKATTFWKKLWGNAFYNQALMLVRKDELQIQLHGNTFFAGWTVPIQLSSSCILPPACVSLEGYGNVKPDADSMVYPNGYRNVHVYNGMEAFVTFIHPSSKYSGPGTDGVLARESIATIYPPEK